MAAKLLRRLLDRTLEHGHGNLLALASAPPCKREVERSLQPTTGLVGRRQRRFEGTVDRL